MLKNESYLSPSTNGQIISQRELKSKRIFYRITDVVGVKYGHKITVTTIYIPSAKSQLKNKSIFSKNKFIIDASYNSPARKRRQDGYLK
jgi:hypothetical protein